MHKLELPAVISPTRNKVSEIKGISMAPCAAMQHYQVWEYGGMICASYFLLNSLFLDKSPLQFTAETSLCTSK